MNFCKYYLNEKKLNEYINKKQPNLITMNSKTLKLLEFNYKSPCYSLNVLQYLPNGIIETYQGIKVLIDDSLDIGEIEFYYKNKESD